MTPLTSRAMQVAEPGSGLTLVQAQTPDPGPGQVRITVEACGICHSDAMIAAGFLPGTTFPVTTGH
jgi:D-arabinose 1-dehydrogenase-like Zn-dependent alcohol dehydrogenase